MKTWYTLPNVALPTVLNVSTHTHKKYIYIFWIETKKQEAQILAYQRDTVIS